MRELLDTLKEYKRMIERLAIPICEINCSIHQEYINQMDAMYPETKINFKELNYDDPDFFLTDIQIVHINNQMLDLFHEQDINKLYLLENITFRDYIRELKKQALSMFANKKCLIEKEAVIIPQKHKKIKIRYNINIYKNDSDKLMILASIVNYDAI